MLARGGEAALHNFLIGVPLLQRDMTAAAAPCTCATHFRDSEVQHGSSNTAHAKCRFSGVI